MNPPTAFFRPKYLKLMLTSNSLVTLPSAKLSYSMSYFTPPAYIFPDNFQNLIFSKDAMDLKVCNTSLFSMLHPNLPWSSSTALLIAPDYV